MFGKRTLNSPKRSGVGTKRKFLWKKTEQAHSSSLETAAQWRLRQMRHVWLSLKSRMMISGGRSPELIIKLHEDREAILILFHLSHINRIGYCYLAVEVNEIYSWCGSGIA